MKQLQPVAVAKQFAIVKLENVVNLGKFVVAMVSNKINLKLAFLKSVETFLREGINNLPVIFLRVD